MVRFSRFKRNILLSQDFKRMSAFFTNRGYTSANPLFFKAFIFGILCALANTESVDSWLQEYDIGRQKVATIFYERIS